MRTERQTHFTPTGAPCVQLSDLPGVFFLGGNELFTAWAADKNDALPAKAKGLMEIEITEEAEQRGRRYRKQYERLINKP